MKKKTKNKVLIWISLAILLIVILIIIRFFVYKSYQATIPIDLIKSATGFGSGGGGHA